MTKETPLAEKEMSVNNKPLGCYSKHNVKLAVERLKEEFELNKTKPINKKTFESEYYATRFIWNRIDKILGEFK